VARVSRYRRQFTYDSETNREKPLRLAADRHVRRREDVLDKRLAASGYPAVSCDDRIEQKLVLGLRPADTRASTASRRDGWPDSATYTERESEYLAEEIHTLDEF